MSRSWDATRSFPMHQILSVLFAFSLSGLAFAATLI